MMRKKELPANSLKIISECYETEMDIITTKCCNQYLVLDYPANSVLEVYIKYWTRSLPVGTYGQYYQKVPIGASKIHINYAEYSSNCLVNTGYNSMISVSSITPSSDDKYIYTF